MASNTPSDHFPDISSKLEAPRILSAYEKGKKAAREKELREQEKAEILLKDFINDHTNGEDDGHRPSQIVSAGPRSFDRHRGGYAPPYHGPRSGPGSLGMPPPPPDRKRKRQQEEARERARQAEVDEEADDEFDRVSGQEPAPRMQRSDSIDLAMEDLESRPIVRLSSLPPHMTISDVSKLFKDRLEIHSVEIVSPHNSNYDEKKSLSAVVRLAHDIPVAHIDRAVSALSATYLGWGYKLSIDRQLSSTLLLPPRMMSLVEPFGAQKPADNRRERSSLRHAPPPGSFAASSHSDYELHHGHGDDDGNSFRAVVRIQAPPEIATMRAVHTIADRLLSESDPYRALEIEAMLMALPEVQKDPRFAFLYDSSTAEGAYYRYLMWSDEFQEISSSSDRPPTYERLFDDDDIGWIKPDPRMAYFDLTQLGNLKKHDDFDALGGDSAMSSQDEDEDNNELGNGRTERNAGNHDDKMFNPMWKTKLAWLLATAPRSIASLSVGDLEGSTYYAMRLATQAAEEVADMLVLNVTKPYAFTDCATYGRPDDFEDDNLQVHDEPDDLTSDPPTDALPMSENTTTQIPKIAQDDLSQIKLVALYFISDVLNASSTGGFRTAWKYRQAIQKAFEQQRTWEHLGQLDKQLDWGRMKTEKWRKSIDVLFDIWDKWNVFPAGGLDVFKTQFYGKKEEEEATADHPDNVVVPKTNGAKNTISRFKKPRFTSVSSLSAAQSSDTVSVERDADLPVREDAGGVALVDDNDGIPMDEDIDGAPMNEDVDGAPMDEDIDGIPMDEDVDGISMDEDVDDVPMNEHVDGTPTDKHAEKNPMDAVDAQMDVVGATSHNEETQFASNDSATKSGVSTGIQAQKEAAQMPEPKEMHDMFADSDED